MSAVSPALAERVDTGSGENVYKCYQCKRCTVGCPVAEFGDLHPAQIMRAVQLGHVDRAVQSRFIWLCTGCQTCSTRCPQGIDIAAVMDELRMVARERGMVRKDAPFANILKLINDSTRRWGRLYEVELLALDRVMRPGTVLDDAGLGMRMFLKGKIDPRPSLGDRKQMKRMLQVIESIEGARSLQRLPIDGATPAERAAALRPEPPAAEPAPAGADTATRAADHDRGGAA